MDIGEIQIGKQVSPINVILGTLIFSLVVVPLLIFKGSVLVEMLDE